MHVLHRHGYRSGLRPRWYSWTRDVKNESHSQNVYSGMNAFRSIAPLSRQRSERSSKSTLKLADKSAKTVDSMHSRDVCYNSSLILESRTFVVSIVQRRRTGEHEDLAESSANEKRPRSAQMTAKSFIAILERKHLKFSEVSFGLSFEISPQAVQPPTLMPVTW